MYFSPHPISAEQFLRHRCAETARLLRFHHRPARREPAGVRRRPGRWSPQA